MPKDLATSSLEMMWKLIEDAFEYSNEYYINIKASLSLKGFFREKLAGGELSPDEQDRVLLLAELWDLSLEIPGRGRA